MTTPTSLLLDTARRGELHHAIILHGPSPSLLRDLSVRLAKTLNCLNGSTSDDCASCQRIDRRTHPDVHFIEAAADKKLISIEQIRDIVSEASLRPYEGRSTQRLGCPQCDGETNCAQEGKGLCYGTQLDETKSK